VLIRSVAIQDKRKTSPIRRATISRVKICDSCRTSYPHEFTICPKDQTPLHQVGELTPGMVLRGKYELIAKLGAGGMGAVYKARHLAFGELRALKIIGAHLLADEGFVGRFKSEAVVTRKLQHPNVVRVEDLDTTDDGQPFIVMEYVEGESLRGIVQRTGPLGVPRALDLAAQACLALSAAHGLGILHRDIKPDNILIIAGPDGRETAKVLDFGLAKVLSGFQGATGQAATSTGIMMGTPHYMAPEQALAQKSVDGRVDLYALGVVLYEMLTGNVPFDSDTPMGIVYQHIQAVAVPPGEAYPALGIPPAVSALVMKAMEKDPANRYASAEEMHAAIVALGASMPQGAASSPRPATSAPAPPRTAQRLPGAPNSGAMPTVPPRSPAPPTAPPPLATAPAPARTPPRPVPGSPTRVQTGVVRPTMEDDVEESQSAWSVAKWIAGLVIVLGILIYWRRASSPSSAPASPVRAAADTAANPTVLPAVAADSGAPAANSDDTVRAEVQRVLWFSPEVKGGTYDVSVTNGIVTLKGTVPNATTRDLATSLAAGVSGVRRVIASLEVAGDGVMAAPPAGVATDAPTRAPSPPPATSAGDRVRELMEQARREVERGNHEAAHKIFEEVLSIDPDNAGAREGYQRSGDAMRNPPQGGGGPPQGGGPQGGGPPPRR
jgi:serine/threonine-protein kinase